MDIITILLCYLSALIIVHGENGASGDTTRLVVMEPSSLPTPIATSAQTFEDLMNQGNIFIDKTLFIKNLVINKADYPIRVVARPKGWGKTVNLKMLETFFSAEVDPINYKIRPRNQTQAFRLFEHSEVVSPNDEVRKLDQPLLITQYTEIMSMHQGVYPVVYMDFSGIKGRYSTEFEVEMLTRVNLLEEKYELKSIVEVLRASGQYVDKKMLEILNLNTEPKTSTSKKSKSETEKKTTVPLELKDNTKTVVTGPAKPDSVDMKAVDSKRGAETTKAGEIKLAGLKKMAEEVEKKILEKEAAKTATVTKTTKAKPTGPKVTLANATTVPSKRKKKTTLPNIPGVRIIDLDRAEELEREGMFDTTPDPKVEDNPKMFKNDTELKNAWARKLKCICNLLGIYFQRKPVILIDNYDDPFIQVISQPGVLRRTDAMRSMWQFYNILFDQFKNDTRFYSLLVVSGMMRIGLPGLMKDFELEQSGRFIPPSGFTEKEVDMIFEHIDMPTTLRTKAHAYYGGYQFSEYEYNMFHPSSIASFVATKKAKRYLRSDGAIDKYFEKCLRDTNRKVNEDPVSRHLCGRVLRDAGHLIKGITELDLKHFSGYKELSEEISKVFPTTAAALCYAAGYITLERHTSSEEAFGEVGLKVPNQEIKDLMISQPEFEDIIYKWSDEDDKPTADDSHDFMPDDSAVKVTKGTKKTSLK